MSKNKKAMVGTIMPLIVFLKVNKHNKKSRVVSLKLEPESKIILFDALKYFLLCEKNSKARKKHINLFVCKKI